MKANSRKEAKELGLKHYFTGNPCPKGHIADRFVSNGTCAECLSIQAASFEKKAYDRAYYKKNSDRISARGKVYYEENREKKLKQAAEWAANNKEKVRDIKKNYKFRRRSIESNGMNSAELTEWKNNQEKICFWCLSKCDSEYHIDHIQPLAKGGKHIAENLAISCPGCNLTKNARTPEEFIKIMNKRGQIDGKRNYYR
jgi:5-methylcytosine-specific restriction endonuclease McrA